MAQTRPGRIGEMEEEPLNGALENFVGYNLKRAYMVIQADFRKIQGSEGLSTRVFSALSLVVEYPQITQSELARMLGIERSGLVAITDELERRNYLTRVPVPGDRRVQALVPTQAGQTAYKDCLALVQAHEDGLLTGLSDKERETLVDLLRKIRASGEGDD